MHALVGGMPTGSPAVVFESGLGYPLEIWTHLQRELAADTLTVAYERAGVCWSDPGPRPRSLDRLAADLRALLDALDLPGPAIVVGHSFGGLVAHRFALDHPDRAAGVVFLDALHPQELRRSSRQRRVMAWTEQNLQLSALHCAVGMSRKRLRAQFTELPDDVAERARARIAEPGTWRTALAELRHWKNSDLSQTDPGRFAPHVRVGLVGSGDSVRSDVGRKKLEQELLGLSDRSFALLAREVGHADLVYEPAGVAAAAKAIRAVLSDVKGVRHAS